jgi:hypothetical protein
VHFVLEYPHYDVRVFSHQPSRLTIRVKRLSQLHWKSSGGRKLSEERRAATDAPIADRKRLKALSNIRRSEARSNLPINDPASKSVRHEDL